MSVKIGEGAGNVVIGKVSITTVAGDYHDHSVEKINSTIYQGTVNNVGRADNVNFGLNYGNIQQNSTSSGHDDGTNPFHRNATAGYPAQGPRPPMGEFPASAPAVPHYQQTRYHPQQAGPTPSAPPQPTHRYTDPGRPEGQRAWQEHQANQQGPPAAYPPPGHQAQPQQGPPTDCPPWYQSQPQPQPQRRKERWPGEHILQDHGLLGDSASDSSEDEGSAQRAKGKKTRRMEDPNEGLGQGQSAQASAGQSAAALGGTTRSVGLTIAPLG